MVRPIKHDRHLPHTKDGRTMLNVAARRQDFHALHTEGYFLLPTAWDVGSAKRLEAMGFAGFATSIASLASALARPQDQVTRDEILAHLRQLVDATEIAVNADFGTGFTDDIAELASSVRLVIDTGIDALSINDGSIGQRTDRGSAEERIRVCRQAIAASGAEVLLVARAIGPCHDRASIEDTIQRLVAYSEAGADVVSAPALADPSAIKVLVDAVAPNAVDVQLTRHGLTAAQLGDIGVRRISIGDVFAEVTWSAFERVAQHFIDFGDLPVGMKARP